MKAYIAAEVQFMGEIIPWQPFLFSFFADALLAELVQAAEIPLTTYVRQHVLVRDATDTLWDAEWRSEVVLSKWQPTRGSRQCRPGMTTRSLSQAEEGSFHTLKK
eukprot:2467836-Karenia_brevis.AAC.1